MGLRFPAIAVVIGFIAIAAALGIPRVKIDDLCHYTKAAALR